MFGMSPLAKHYPAAFLPLMLGLSSPAVLALPEDTINFVGGIAASNDSNFFRGPSGAETGETINVGTAGLRLDKQYSLQRLMLNLSASEYRFRTNSYLDYSAKNADASWQWSVTPHLHGTLQATHGESLNSFVDYNGRQRNIRKTDVLRGDFELEAWGRIRLLGGATRTTIANGLATFDDGDLTIRAPEFGLKYQLPSGSYLSLVSRRATGEYNKRALNPRAVLDTGFAQNDTEVRFHWLLGGKSTLNGRVARVARDFDHYEQRSYSGTVSSLDYQWDLSGKIRLGLGWRNDLVSYQTYDASFYKVRGVNFTPVWQLSGKAAVRGRFANERRDYQGAVQIGLPQRDERWRQGLLAFDWSPMRTLTLSASIQRERRDSSIDGADFSDRLISMSANLAF